MMGCVSNQEDEHKFPGLTETTIQVESERETEREKIEETTEPVTTEKIEETEEVETDEQEYFIAPDIYADVDSFVSDWWQRKVDRLQESGVNSINTQMSVVVPGLKSPDFKLLAVEVNEYAYQFYYVPVDFDEPWFDHKVGIEFTVTIKDMTFDAVMRQMGQNPEGVSWGYAMAHNMWMFDIDDDYEDNLLYIQFPPNLPVQTEEELYSYFEFEKRTYTAETAAVQ
jgi:hypothetical protein